MGQPLVAAQNGVSGDEPLGKPAKPGPRDRGELDPESLGRRLIGALFRVRIQRNLGLNKK